MSAKTAKGWVVVNKGGHVIAVSIRRKDAMDKARDFLTWKQLRRWGCRCLPCTITVTEEPTK